jgi:hypothetical protein
MLFTWPSLLHLQHSDFSLDITLLREAAFTLQSDSPLVLLTTSFLVALNGV